MSFLNNKKMQVSVSDTREDFYTEAMLQALADDRGTVQVLTQDLDEVKENNICFSNFWRAMTDPLCHRQYPVSTEHSCWWGYTIRWAVLPSFGNICSFDIPWLCFIQELTFVLPKVAYSSMRMLLCLIMPWSIIYDINCHHVQCPWGIPLLQFKYQNPQM